MIGKNTKDTWDKILEDGGSVQGIDWMDNYYVHHGELEGMPIHKDELSEEDMKDFIPMKDVFRTFKEINQMELVRQAGVRQQYVDQAVSLNLAFPNTADPKFINQVHLEAYDQGIKTLYYMRTESVLRGDIATRATDPDCLSCDG
jgi:ribonucleoside-diphosphate reductase alpha chain